MHIQNIRDAWRKYALYAAALTGTFILMWVYVLKAQDVQLPYVENGMLYKSTTSSAGSKVADNVDRVVVYDAKSAQILYLVHTQQSTGHSRGKQLVLADMVTSNKKILTDDAIMAAMSPDGDKIAVTNAEFEVHILNAAGSDLKRVGMHGGAAVFSNEGRYLAYQKLADTSFDGDSYSLFEKSPYGIALYDTLADKEIILTTSKDDYDPVGFSSDGEKLYFNSARAYPNSHGFENHIVSLWVVDVKTKAVKRLTNLDENTERKGIHVPSIAPNALWSADRKTIISSGGSDEGVWRFKFDNQGNLAGAEHIADGESPRWVVPDKSIAVRIISNGKGVWRTLDIQ